MKYKLEYVDGKSKISINGYAFIDENGGTIIIVYGEGRRDDMSEYLNRKDDPLGLKYKIIDLLS